MRLRKQQTRGTCAKNECVSHTRPNDSLTCKLFRSHFIATSFFLGVSPQAEQTEKSYCYISSSVHCPCCVGLSQNWLRLWKTLDMYWLCIFQGNQNLVFKNG